MINCPNFLHKAPNKFHINKKKSEFSFPPKYKREKKKLNRRFFLLKVRLSTHQLKMKYPLKIYVNVSTFAIPILCFSYQTLFPRKFNKFSINIRTHTMEQQNFFGNLVFASKFRIETNVFNGRFYICCKSFKKVCENQKLQTTFFV